MKRSPVSGIIILVSMSSLLLGDEDFGDAPEYPPSYFYPTLLPNGALCLPKIPYLLVYRKLRSMTVYCASFRKCIFSQAIIPDVHYQSSVDLVAQPIHEQKRSAIGESGSASAIGCPATNHQATETPQPR